MLFLWSCSTTTLDSYTWENGKSFSVENGVVSKEGVLFSGTIIKKFKNGNIQSKAQYLNGKLNGTLESWYLDGDLSENRSYSNGIKTGVHKGWWSNSKPKFIYNFNTAGQYEGELLEWTKLGGTYKIMNFNNGKEAGHQRIWDEKGNIKCNYTAINGDRFGLVNMKSCYTVDNENSEVKM